MKGKVLPTEKTLISSARDARLNIRIPLDLSLLLSMESVELKKQNVKYSSMSDIVIKAIESYLSNESNFKSWNK